MYLSEFTRQKYRALMHEDRQRVPQRRELFTVAKGGEQMRVKRLLHALQPTSIKSKLAELGVTEAYNIVGQFPNSTGRWEHPEVIEDAPDGWLFPMQDFSIQHPDADLPSATAPGGKWFTVLEVDAVS